MHFTRETVITVGKLAKLALDSEEVLSLTGELQGFVEYLRGLKALAQEEGTPGLTEVAEYGHKAEAASLSQEQVLALAPDRDKGYVRTPRVVDNE